jgi:L-arabinose isomerase
MLKIFVVEFETINPESLIKWKTAALLRIMKIMADGKGTILHGRLYVSYRPGSELVLGAHM